MDNNGVLEARIDILQQEVAELKHTLQGRRSKT